MRALVILALALVTVMPTPALAWWDYGHRTIASIADRNISPRSQAAIRTLLARAPELVTPDCPLTSIEDASVWPGCIKPLGDRFSYAYNWHYQNVNICKPFDIKAACPDGNCVSAQIDRNARLLADKAVPPRERLMALAFLVHFVGDLHQPLHAGDHGDLGGNRLKARYGDFSAERLNLHAIWDGWLAERAISTPQSLVRTYTAAERTDMGSGTSADWSRENWEVSRDFVYATVKDGKPCDPAPTQRVTLGNADIPVLVPIVRKQVERGGLRLARLLDEALDGSAPMKTPARVR